MIDTHCHLESKEYDEDRDQLIADLANHGVEQVITIGCDPKRAKLALELAEKYEMVYATVGIHPHDAAQHRVEELRPFLDKEKVVAIGECGLDYHYDFSPREVQRERFAEQLELSIEHNLPVVMHIREATTDALEILKQYQGKLRGVAHCFSGDQKLEDFLLAEGLYVSYTGVITFKNGGEVKESVKRVPLKKILLETDAPYLAPEPYRGKRNEPKHLRLIAEKIAELKGVSTEEVIKQTTENARKLFGM